MTRKGLTLSIAIIFLVLSSLACSFGGLVNPVRGSGDIGEKIYKPDDVTDVSLNTQGDLTIEYGEEEELVIEAEENLIPYLEVRMVNHTLHIRTRPNTWIRPTRPIKYHLTVTELSSIELTGSGNAEGPVLEDKDTSVRVTGSGDVTLDGMHAEDTAEIKVTGSGRVCVTGDDADGMNVRGDRVYVTITGSGDVDLGEMEADRLEVRLTGSGDLTVEGGRVEDQTLSTSGSGVYGARDLESATANVHISGSGSVTIRVNDELEASITGSGDVRYAGDPTVQEKTSGSGDVRRVSE